MTLPRSAYALSAAGLTAALLADSGVAFAAWAARGTGQATAGATSLATVTGVTATATDSSVRVDWSAAGPAAGYRVFRYATGSSTPAAIGSGCSGVRGSTSCTETSVPDGTWQYAVRAVQGPWSGPAGTRASVTVFTPVVTSGTAAVTFPAAASKHGSGTWARNCTGFCGTATPSTGATLTKVQVSVRRTGGGYWTGSAFTGSAEQFLTATGNLANWQIPFAFSNFADGDYVLHVVTTDSANQTVNVTSGFSVDATPPTMVDVQAANKAGNTAGQLDAGDTLELTYSEPISPASIIGSWDGSARSITVRVAQCATSGCKTPDTLTFLDSAGNLLPLGTVTMGVAGYFKKSSPTVDMPATVVVSGSKVTVTLGTAPAAGQLNTVTQGTMSWTSGAVQDIVGNVLVTNPVPVRLETGAADIDF
ncbi:hypothetical protein GCM10010168_10380 [Actinoplanes ianthinogenes]|uniref:Fibronectin type-III domain-containing protein n=1 Tax=Actinoplanes ianthinogenes TaxID=122358 RepID=A0ABM7LY41_9ACTN|nr:hypothetical protein [Actinoplanes ianthinogenes]BCJ44225.1 hypothetical protein Aiant_48820 [Actinoplanes ianthinogenes]GGQ96619.1 hypothetical protein GCM10010168_10380 [Actinoplanes ianthinogenes]